MPSHSINQSTLHGDIESSREAVCLCVGRERFVSADISMNSSVDPGCDDRLASHCMHCTKHDDASPLRSSR